MKHLAVAVAGLFWLMNSAPEANAVVACAPGYYWSGGRCVVVVRRPAAAAPATQCYWRAGVRVCR